MIEFSRVAARTSAPPPHCCPRSPSRSRSTRRWSTAIPPSLDTFAIAVAATITLMFVTVLLVAGSLALEREENAFARLTRGLVAKSALLGEKVLLGVVARAPRDAADARRARSSSISTGAGSA